MAVQSPPARTASLASTARPLFAGYTAFGTFWGVWVVVFADFLRARGISEGEAGLQLAALSATSILTMTVVAPRLRALPLSVTTSLGLAVFAATSALVSRAEGGWIAVAFAGIGIGNGLIDVFVNVGGQAVEAERHRPLLQYLHAWYSVGSVIGALGAAAAHAAGLRFGASLDVAAVAFAASALWCAASPGLRERRAGDGRSAFSLAVFARAPFLVIPALVVMSAFLVEGSMDIWSVIYLRETLGASVVAGGVAFAAFAGAMAVGRLTAARVLFPFGYRATLRVSGAGSLLAGAVAALAGDPVVAGVAFLFLGFFISSAAPAAFGLIAQTDVDPSLAIAGMTTIGYTGFVIGPPFMGWLAEAVGLRATMAVLVSMALGVVVGGVLAPPPGERATRG